MFRSRALVRPDFKDICTLLYTISGLKQVEDKYQTVRQNSLLKNTSVLNTTFDSFDILACIPNIKPSTTCYPFRISPDTI